MFTTTKIPFEQGKGKSLELKTDNSTNCFLLPDEAKFLMERKSQENQIQK